jgi:hypothetical protein
VNGFAMVNGVQSGQLNSPNQIDDLVMQISGAPFLLGDALSPYVLHSTFMLTGVWSHFTPQGFTEYDFFGSGTSTLTLIDLSSFGTSGLRQAGRLEYDLVDPAAMPEPTTLFLLGTGLVVADRRIRRL